MRVKELREFFGVMALHQLKRGTYATTSTYTPDAQQFAKSVGINALDGAGLLKLIATRTVEQQQALLEVALEGDYARPTCASCASCGVKMVERTPSSAGARFYGCSHYPRCKSRLPMSATPQPYKNISLIAGNAGAASARCSFPRGCSPEVKEDGGSDISQLSSGLPG